MMMMNNDDDDDDDNGYFLVRGMTLRALIQSQVEYLHAM